MILKGKITDGRGEASFWVKKIEKVFKEKEKIELFHGTLNVRTDKEYMLDPCWILSPEEYGGTQKVFIQKCKLFGNNSYIVRAEKTIHKTNVVEIVSNINFREKYNLKNEDEVTITI